MKLDLFDEQAAALVKSLDKMIDEDRYPLSPRIQMLRQIRHLMRPEPPRQPLPPLKYYDPAARFGSPETPTLSARQVSGRSPSMVGSERDRLLDAVRRVAAQDGYGLADPDDVASELGIGLWEVTELVRRYQDDFDWEEVPLGKLNCVNGSNETPAETPASAACGDRRSALPGFPRRGYPMVTA
jgi:hypothetical protein